MVIAMELESLNEIKDWDIVVVGDDERVCGWVKALKNPTPGVCTEMIDIEILSSAIISVEGCLLSQISPGDEVTTKSGSIYKLSGPRRRKDWKTQHLLSVGGPEYLKLEHVSRMAGAL